MHSIAVRNEKKNHIKLLPPLHYVFVVVLLVSLLLCPSKLIMRSKPTYSALSEYEGKTHRNE